ncbi:MAG: DUF4336 domain-containing protein [Cyanobacteria bacterium J06554_6]
MLRLLDENLWVAEQPLRYMGLMVGTRMTLIRLQEGELAVISPIRIDKATDAEIRSVGRVAHIIIPNLYHSLNAASCKARYPKAVLWAVPGLQAKRPDLVIDQTIDTVTCPWPGLQPLFFNGFRTLGFNGFDILNECVFLHGASRTLILTDTAFHFDESFPALTRLTMGIIGGYKRLQPSLLEKVASERETVRRSIEQVLGWDFDRVIMAHGSVIESQGKERLRKGYEQFLGQPL